MPRVPSTSDNKRNNVCTICQKSFTTSGHLHRHSKVHTGERKHRCPFPGCETSCSRADNLQQHYRIHLSQGSRRSSSAHRARSETGSKKSGRKSSMPTPLVAPSPLPPILIEAPYTIVDGPPVVHAPMRFNAFTKALSAPSPPNTPPPLVPASPRLAAMKYHLHQEALIRRHSSGSIVDAADATGYTDFLEHGYRYQESSCSSSSAGGSPAPPFEPFNVSVPWNELKSSDTGSTWYANEVNPHWQLATTPGDVYTSHDTISTSEYLGYGSNLPSNDPSCLLKNPLFTFDMTSRDSSPFPSFSRPMVPHNTPPAYTHPVVPEFPIQSYSTYHCQGDRSHNTAELFSTQPFQGSFIGNDMSRTHAHDHNLFNEQTSVDFVDYSWW